MPVVTTTVPATERPTGYVYGVSHDGAHWVGSFSALLDAFLTDLIDDGPLELTFDVYSDPRSDDLRRVTGEVTSVTEEQITFSDGHVLSRLDSQIIAAWVTSS